MKITFSGVKFFQPAMCSEDATSVALLRGAGALILGKANLKVSPEDQRDRERRETCIAALRKRRRGGGE